MRRSGEAPTLDIGPLVRALLDPQTLIEAKVTAKARVVTVVVDTAKLVRAQHEAGDFATFDRRAADVAAESIFAELVAFAQSTSASLADATSVEVRPAVEAALTARVARDLAALGLGVAKLEETSLELDPATEAWLRARRASVRVPAAAPSLGPPDASTEVAAMCRDCGAQVATLASACPLCGGVVGAATPCRRCGTLVRPASRFCVGCGTEVGKP